MADLREFAAAERGAFADYLDTLTAEQWDQPTLCTGWTVREVAAHVPGYDELGWPALFALLVRSRLSLARANQAGVERNRELNPQQLVSRLRACANPRGITTMFGCAIALTDMLIHHQDIRRALGQPRTVPAERLLAALDFAPRARALPAPANARGLRFVATDIDWTHGTGPEVHGPGEALLVAIAGRPHALADLTGPGLPTLTRRLAPTNTSVP